MANLENFRKRAKTLVKQHREWHYPVAQKLRDALPRFAGQTDRAILAAAFSLADAQQIVAREAGYDSWAAAAEVLAKSPRPRIAASQRAPVLCIAYPQVFVIDVRRSAEFYVQALGFTVVYLYGDPPFYGLVQRNGVGLNLRHVDAPILAPANLTEDSLLSASIVVDGVKALFLEFRRRGAVFAQSLKLQPWGATDFIVRDPDGNLLCFASPASDNDAAAARA